MGQVRWVGPRRCYSYECVCYSKTVQRPVVHTLGGIQAFSGRKGDLAARSKRGLRGVALSESALAALKSVTCMGHELRPSKATRLTADEKAALLLVTVV